MKKYQEPELEVILFADGGDVLTNSDQHGGGGDEM